MTEEKTDRPLGLGDFESTLAELEELVARMENGEQTLEQSLKDFERGVALTKTCQAMLQQAEQIVQQLVTTPTGEEELQPFPRDDS